MLDSNLKDQLKDVFSRLTGKVILRAAKSSHSGQAELVEMLEAAAGQCDRLSFERSEGGTSEHPAFEVLGEKGEKGIAFRGIPGGHEFSSFVLAVLHRDGKGKLPDAGVIARIRALKGPIRLRTYVSLSCENCPEVVQALNLMATLHPDFHHETVDGALVQAELETLGIQGVPSVMHGDALIHSGKSQLIDLLAALESAFGKVPLAGKEESLGLFDVAVIGGGPAGSSSAIYSARKGLKTALIAERFGGQLRETKGIENMISVAYTEGAKLAAQLSDHIASYPISLFEHRRVRDISGDGVKRIRLESGEWLDAKAIIVATGAKWRQLGIPGEKEHIGLGVAFCAHCDGPFYKGKRVTVVGGGNSGAEAALDLAGIAAHVTLLEYGERLRADAVLVEKLEALPNVRILTRAKSTRVIGDGKKVSGLEYQDLADDSLKVLDVDGVFVQIGLQPNSHFVKDLVKLTPGGEIIVDTKGRTDIPGIYAAGDVTTIPYKQIVVAMGDGAKAALTAFGDRMHAKAA
jgi:alkyl hydroperoxide reductase subunit F